MNYFDQLKAKHENPEKAYIEYQLSKTYLRVFGYSPDAPEDIKSSMQLQEKLNVYCEALINAGPKDSVNFRHIFGITDIPKFWGENEERLMFLGLDREKFISLLSGMYEMNLTGSSKGMQWDSLEQIINEEKNNTPIIEKAKAQELINSTIMEYGLSSLTFGQCRTNESSLENASESLNQLSLVIDCDKKQVGSHKFNLFFDTEDGNFAGYSNQFLGQQKLYINERLSYDAFAHEWFHSIDNMMANYNKLDSSHASSTNFKSMDELLNKSVEINAQAIEEIKKHVSEKCLTHLVNIVNRYDAVGQINNPEEFKDFLIKEHQKAINDNWDKEAFFINAQKYQKEVIPCTSYLASELELVKEVMNKDLNVSSFYKYAVLMDKNLQSSQIMDDEYSTTRLEMIARSFETFVDIKLEEKGVKNIISNSTGNNYTPDKEEMKFYLNKWENVLKDIKEMLNKVCPVEKENNFDVSKITANINNIRLNSLKTKSTNNGLQIG